MSTYIVKTTLLGHEGAVYEVETSLPLPMFTIVDSKYGMKYRHQSTTIEQLQHGARDMGFDFEFKVLHKMDNNWDKIHEYKHDYFARSGNY